MLHYYLQKGILPNEIIKLSPLEKSFFESSMIIELEEQTKANKGA